MASSLTDLGSMTISVSTLLNWALTGALAAGVYYIAQGSTKEKVKSGTATPIVGGSGKKKNSAKGKKKADVTSTVQSSGEAAKVEPDQSKKDTATTGSKKKSGAKKTTDTPSKVTPIMAESAEAPTYAEIVDESAHPSTSASSSLTDSKAANTSTDETFASVAASTTEARVPKSKKKKAKPNQSLAEAHLAPKLSKAAEADPALKDMRDEEHDPTVQVARVLKVVGGTIGAKPKSEDEDDDDGWERVPREDDGWEVAGSKKPNKTAASSSSSSAAFSASNPAPARSIPGLTAQAQQAMTKKQRENQAKAVKAAAVKEAAEEERLARLTAHRKQLERIRMLEQEAQRNKGKKSGPKSVNYPTSPSNVTGNKTQSGGMYASLDEDGKLIWE